jgi:membrane protein
MSESTSTTKAGRFEAVKQWIDDRQQRVRPVAFIVGVIKKFGDDRGGRLAALVAYYGFFSLFPLMLSLVTVLAFVLEDRPDLRDDIEQSALGQFPVLGDSIAGASGQALTGSTAAIVLGLLGAAWAGLAAMQAAQDAMNEAWDVPRASYPNFFLKRLRSLAMLGLLGALLIVSAALTQIVAAIDVIGVVGRGLLMVGSLALTIGVFIVAFHVLTVADISWRNLLPGSIVAGVGYTALQLVGQLYVNRVLNDAENTYGTFGVVIGLLSWLYLQAQITMIGAEVNVVAARRLWPRSLFGPPSTTADRESFTAQVDEARIAKEMEVIVRFDGDAAVPAPPPSSSAPMS